jgi:hypothetical protein
VEEHGNAFEIVPPKPYELFEKTYTRPRRKQESDSKYWDKRAKAAQRQREEEKRPAWMRGGLEKGTSLMSAGIGEEDAQPLVSDASQTQAVPAPVLHPRTERKTNTYQRSHSTVLSEGEQKEEQQLAQRAKTVMQVKNDFIIIFIIVGSFRGLVCVCVCVFVLFIQIVFLAVYLI